MRFLIKSVIIVIGGSLVLLSIGGILAVTQSGPVLRWMAQSSLSHCFQTAATVEEASLSPLSFSLELKGITVANPPEFKADGPAIAIDRVSILLDPATLFTETPAIREVRVQGATLYLHCDAGRGTNIGLLAKRASPSGAATVETKPQRGGFTLQRVRTDAGKLVMSTNLVPSASLGLRVSPFQLEQIDEGRALTAGKTVSILLRSILRETLTAKGLLEPAAQVLRRELQDVGIQAVGAS